MIFVAIALGANFAALLAIYMRLDDILRVQRGLLRAQTRGHH